MTITEYTALTGFVAGNTGGKKIICPILQIKN